MHRLSRAALSLAFAVALLLPLAASGQAPPAPREQDEPEVFGETIDVRAVNLEVVVEDRAGKRVTGLGPADFVLTVDGKPVSIDYFTEIAEGRAIAGGAEAAPPDVEGIEPGSEVGTSYLVFIDETMNVVVRDRNLILRGFADQISRLRPQDRMAVVGFDGHRAALLSDWNRSPDTLRGVLEKAMLRPVRVGAAAAVLGELALARLQPGKPPVVPETGGRALRPSLPESLLEDVVVDSCTGLRRQERRMQRIAAGLTASMRSLADAPGRKVALVIASGWPRLEKDVTCGNLGPALWEPVHDVANQVGFTLYMTMSQDPPPAISIDDREPPDQLVSNPRRSGARSRTRSSAWRARPAAGPGRATPGATCWSWSPTTRAPTTGWVSPRPGRATTRRTR